MEEAESKAQALERVADLEDELGRANERLQELEVSVNVIVCLTVRRFVIPLLPLPIKWVSERVRGLLIRSHCVNVTLHF